MKSIMQNGGYCWLCGKNGSAEPLDKHHVFGGALRGKSERYGLTVYLCHGSCHIFGERAAHRSRETRELLQAAAQRAAIKRYGWTREDFRREFGKNYLDDEPEVGEEESGGFRALDEELCVSW